MLIKAGQLDKTFASAEFMQLFWNIWYDSVCGFLDEGYAMKETQQAVKQDCLKAVNSSYIQMNYALHLLTFHALCFWKFDLLDSLWCST